VKERDVRNGSRLAESHNAEAAGDQRGKSKGGDASVDRAAFKPVMNQTPKGMLHPARAGANKPPQLVKNSSGFVNTSQEVKASGRLNPLPSPSNAKRHNL